MVNLHINQLFKGITISLLFSIAAYAAPTAEEMWRTIQDQQKVIEQLQKKLGETAEEVEATVEAIESGAGSSGSSWADKTYIGGYGENHYRGGDGTDQIDFHRYVLYIGSDFTDKIHFFSEWELEHTLAGEGQPGEVELEQAWIEIDITDNHHFRYHI